MIEIKINDVTGNFTLRLRNFSARVSAIGFCVSTYFLIAINPGDKCDWLNIYLFLFLKGPLTEKQV